MADNNGPSLASTPSMTSPSIASTIPSPSDPEKGLISKSPSETASHSLRRRILIWTGIGIAVAAITALALGLGLHFGLQNNPSMRPTTVSKPPAQPAQPAQPSNVLSGPAVDSNFADPAYIKLDDTYWAFATNKYVVHQDGQINIQISKSTDFETWDLLDIDALPVVGDWSAGFQVWAPDVVQLDDGTFVLYYSAAAKADPGKHCIGSATSKNVTGPYTPSPQALVCPLDQGGVIDPEGFKDADGTRYLIYKIDGNSLNKPDEALHPTPLMLQQVSADGVTFVGAPIQLLDRTESDGPLIEAPAMARYVPKDPAQAPIYVLFFSSNVFTGPSYDVSYATASSVRGPFVRSNSRLLKTGDAANKLVGPGGLDCGVDSTQVVFHSIKQSAGQANNIVTRTMWTGDLAVAGNGDVETR